MKIADFGFAKVDRGDLITPQFTPYYASPQVRYSYYILAGVFSVPVSLPGAFETSPNVNHRVNLYIVLSAKDTSEMARFLLQKHSMTIS